MPCVSVIIPCYNAGKYIDRCMKCLENQTIGFENLQVIFVNDGSKDATLGKLMLYEQKYPNQIILINFDANCGQGMAKNTGLKYATAEYIAFLDVDDEIADTFYEKLYGIISTGNYDWVSAKFVHILPEERPDFREPEYKNDIEFHCPEDESLLFTEYDRDMHNGQFGILPARIFRKSLIVENQIYFPEGLMYEDNYWGAKCNIFSKHVYILDEVLYCYYRNRNSVVSSGNAAYHLDRMKIEEMVVDLCKENNLFERYYTQIEERFLEFYYCGTWFAVFFKMNTIPDILPVMRKKIYKLFPDYKKNPCIKRFPMCDQTLLKLLEQEEMCTGEVGDLERIKEEYIKAVLCGSFV